MEFGYDGGLGLGLQGGVEGGGVVDVVDAVVRVNVGVDAEAGEGCGGDEGAGEGGLAGA